MIHKPTDQPTALDAATHVGMKVAEFGAYGILLASLVLFWIGTPQ